MKSLRLGARLVLAAVAASALVACGDSSDGSAGDRKTVVVTETPGSNDSTAPTDASSSPTESSTSSVPPSPPPTAMESMTIAPTGSVDEAELAEDLESAVNVTNGWWRKHWKDYFSGRYTKPTIVGLYDGYDEASAPTCFGEPLPPGNAFYCPDGDYLAWDKTLIELGYEIGDSWPYLIIAHEWGHAIQADLDMSLQSQQYELQADCLAGAALYGSREDGTLEFEQGDEKEIVDGLNFIADEVPWGMSGDHGDSFQRIEWFDMGRTDGVPGCLPDQVS